MTDAGGRSRMRQRQRARSGYRSRSYRSSPLREDFSHAIQSGGMKQATAVVFNLAGAATGAAAGYAQAGVGGAIVGGLTGLLTTGTITSALRL